MRRDRTRKSAREEKRSCCSASGTGRVGLSVAVAVAVAVTVAVAVRDDVEVAAESSAATMTAAVIASSVKALDSILATMFAILTLLRFQSAAGW